MKKIASTLIALFVLILITSCFSTYGATTGLFINSNGVIVNPISTISFTGSMTSTTFIGNSYMDLYGYFPSSTNIALKNGTIETAIVATTALGGWPTNWAWGSITNKPDVVVNYQSAVSLGGLRVNGGYIEINGGANSFLRRKYGTVISGGGGNIVDNGTAIGTKGSTLNGRRQVVIGGKTINLGGKRSVFLGTARGKDFGQLKNIVLSTAGERKGFPAGKTYPGLSRKQINIYGQEGVVIRKVGSRSSLWLEEGKMQMGTNKYSFYTTNNDLLFGNGVDNVNLTPKYLQLRINPRISSWPTPIFYELSNNIPVMAFSPDNRLIQIGVEVTGGGFDGSLTYGNTGYGTNYVGPYVAIQATAGGGWNIISNGVVLYSSISSGLYNYPPASGWKDGSSVPVAVTLKYLWGNGAGQTLDFNPFVAWHYSDGITPAAPTASSVVSFTPDYQTDIVYREYWRMDLPSNLILEKTYRAEFYSKYYNSTYKDLGSIVRQVPLTPF